MDPESPYEIFVRDLIALDGATDAELTLIDDRGCPADPTIMSELKKSVSSDKILISLFDAFRFPRYVKLQFIVFMNILGVLYFNFLKNLKLGKKRL